MAIAVTVNSYPDGVDNSQRRTILQGTFTFSGTPASGGDIPSWTASSLGITLDTTATEPIWLEIYSVANSGVIYQWDQSTGAVEAMLQGAAAGDPLAPVTDAYPSSVTDDVVPFKAEFVRSV